MLQEAPTLYDIFDLDNHEMIESTNRPLSVLHVLVTFHAESAAGGPVSNVYAYAQGLLQRGYQVSVCCSDHLDLSRRIQVSVWNHGVSAPAWWDGIHITYLKSQHLGFGGYGMIVSTAAWPYLNTVVQNYDVIHIHGAWNVFSVMAGLAARRHHVPYVLQLHNTYPIRSHRVGLKQLFHQLVRAPLLERASGIIVLTPDEREEYLRSRPQDREKTFIVPSVMPSVQRPERGHFRRQWGIVANDCLLLFLGRLNNEKGLQCLIQSLQLLAGDNIRLVIVGPDAGYRTDLEELVQRLGLANRILFTGPIYGEVKFSILMDADVFVLPSMFEQLPVSALEAALCELPLILSDRCGMTEMVTQAEAGIIVSYGSPQVLAKAIDVLCADCNRRDGMGRNARRMVMEYCDPRKVLNGLESAYLRAIS